MFRLRLEGGGVKLLYRETLYVPDVCYLPATFASLTIIVSYVYVTIDKSDMFIERG